jgi:hypothetical protein
VGMEQGPLSLVRITEGILEWKSSGSSQENRINDRGDLLRWPRDTLYPLKLALTSPTSRCRLLGIVRLRTKGHRVFFSFHQLQVAPYWMAPHSSVRLNHGFAPNSLPTASSI